MPHISKLIAAGLVFLLCSAALPAGAELYQYKDQNGITRLTDNIYSVPAEYRCQLEAYAEIKNLPRDTDIQALEKKALQLPEGEKTVTPKIELKMPVPLDHRPELSDKKPPDSPQPKQAAASSETPAATFDDQKNIAEKEAKEKDVYLKFAVLQITRKTLAEKKAALNQKFQELMQEKEKLESSVNENNEKSVLEYNKNVKILNLKIKHYKKEKKTLQAAIEDYNRKIQKTGKD